MDEDGQIDKAARSGVVGQAEWWGGQIEERVGSGRSGPLLGVREGEKK